MTFRPWSHSRRLWVWLVAAVVAFAAVPGAAALGKADKDTVDELEVEASKDWVFCVTAFDVSSVSPTQRLIGELSARRLARELESVGLRRRSPEEVGAYADFADNEARAAAGKDLAARRAARAELLYSGHPGWKYRKELVKADAEVDAAEEKLLKVEKARSRVEIEGTVKLSEKNANGVLPPEPPPPEFGRFCAENKLDALLTGSVEPYYGRMRLRTKLYSRYLRTVIAEDEIVFSSEDRETALEELSLRLSAFVGGVAPAALAVTTEPPEADIVVDGKLMGHGSVGPMEKRPAPTRIEVTSPLYEGADVTVDLASDELTKVSIGLNPITTDELAIETVEPKKKKRARESAGTQVESAAPQAAAEATPVYSGVTPADSEAPPAEATAAPPETIEKATEPVEKSVGTAETTEAVESMSSEPVVAPVVEAAGAGVEAAGIPVEPAGKAELNEVAVRLGAMYSGTAPIILTLPAGKMSYIEVETKSGLGASGVVSGGGTLVFQLKPLPGKGATPVETARHRFYGAFGRFSIALPIAFFMSGIALVYENAAIWSGDADKEASAEKAGLWANATIAVAVSFFAESAIRCAIYLYEANARATPLAKVESPEDIQHRKKGR